MNKQAADDLDRFLYELDEFCFKKKVASIKDRKHKIMDKLTKF